MNPSAITVNPDYVDCSTLNMAWLEMVKSTRELADSTRDEIHRLADQDVRVLLFNRFKRVSAEFDWALSQGSVESCWGHSGELLEIRELVEELRNG